MTKPLLICDCDEVLLHMVRHFGTWLRESHDIAFTPEARMTMVFDTECQIVSDPRGVEREAMRRLPPFRPGGPLNYR